MGNFIERYCVPAFSKIFPDGRCRLFHLDEDEAEIDLENHKSSSGWEGTDNEIFVLSLMFQIPIRVRGVGWISETKEKIPYPKMGRWIFSEKMFPQLAQAKNDIDIARYDDDEDIFLRAMEDMDQRIVSSGIPFVGLEHRVDPVRLTGIHWEPLREYPTP